MKTKPVTSGNVQSRVLGRFNQVFPLALFPDELIVEELRVVWIKRSGPWMNEIVSTMATDIASVNVSAGPLLGHIHIKSLTGGPEILVDKIVRHNVLQARSLIEGIALGAREGLKIAYDNLATERASLIRAGAIRTRFI
jgi:hypothetical protein